MISQPAHLTLPRVRLTGITTILRGKRALLKVEFPAKPGQRPKEESFILKEGERGGPLEVLEINEKTEQVRLNNSGTITNVTFEKIVAGPAVESAGGASKGRGALYRPTYR